MDPRADSDEVEAFALDRLQRMHRLAGAPVTQQGDIALKLAALVRSRVSEVPGHLDHVESAEFALMAAALADLVLLPTG